MINNKKDKNKLLQESIEEYCHCESHIMILKRQIKDYENRMSELSEIIDKL